MVQNCNGKYDKKNNPNGWLRDNYGNKVTQDDVMQENVQKGAFTIDEYIWWCTHTDKSWDSIGRMIRGSIENIVEEKDD